MKGNPGGLRDFPHPHSLPEGRDSGKVFEGLPFDCGKLRARVGDSIFDNLEHGCKTVILAHSCRYDKNEKKLNRTIVTIRSCASL